MLVLFVKRYRWVHTLISLIGSAVFVLGSVLFMLEVETLPGILFVIGSSGMLLGNIGQLIADRKREQWRLERRERARRPLNLPETGSGRH